MGIKYYSSTGSYRTLLLPPSSSWPWPLLLSAPHVDWWWLWRGPGVVGFCVTFGMFRLLPTVVVSWVSSITLRTDYVCHVELRSNSEPVLISYLLATY